MNLLGIDFEDWYHPELIQRYLTTERKEPTVINGIDKILEFLRENDTYATFFVVGELLEYKPELLDKILGQGHEIAFHTMYHTRMDTPNYKIRFIEEIKKFDKLTFKKSRGFRAPSFSINFKSSWFIDILAENNYLFDSSVMPSRTILYGIAGAETKPYKISSSSLNKNDPNGKLIEFPLLTTKFFGRNIPAAGGFYLRTLPLRLIEKAIKNNNDKGIPATCYIHSWELTPEFMPQIPLSFLDKFITYHNLKNTSSRMSKILKKFKFTSFKKYMSEYRN